MRTIPAKELPTKRFAELVILPAARMIRDELALKFPEHADKLKRVQFSVNSRFTRCLGKARPSTGEVELSRLLAMHENASELGDTIRHELGHIVLPVEAGHGRKWKDLAALFGYTPNARATNMKVTVARKRTRYRHECLRCGSEAHLTGIMSSRIMRGLDCYRHRCANGNLGALRAERVKVSF